MKRFLSLTLCLFMIAAVFLPVFAAEPTTKQRTVKVAYFESAKNMEKDSDGNYCGYTIDYLNDIARFTGWEYEFVECTPAGAFELVGSGAVDIMPMALFSPMRSQLYAFPKYCYGTTALTLFVNESSGINNQNYTSRTSPMTVALVRGTQGESEFDEYAKYNEILYTPVYFDLIPDACAAVANGDVQAGVVSDYQKPDGTKAVARFAQNDYYFITSKGNSEILDGLNTALAAINFGDPDHISRMYAKYYDNFDNIIPFSARELEYIHSLGVVRIGCTSKWECMGVVDSETGAASGIIIDILNTAAANASLSFEYVPYERKDIDTITSAVTGGDIDIAAFYLGSEEKSDEQNLIVSQPLLDIPMVIITKFSGSPGDSYASTYVPEKGYFPGTQNMTRITYETSSECLDALVSGKVDWAILNAYSAGSLLRDSRYKSLESTTLQDSAVQLRVAFSADADPLLISVIGKALSSVTTADINEIIVYNSVEASEQNLDTLVQENPIMSVAVVSVFFVLLLIAIIYFSGINRRKLLAEKNLQLEQALVIAENASKAKGNFMARMSHEIRTPLNAVVGFNSIARSTLDGEKNAEERRLADMKVMDCLMKSDIASKHLLAIINDVLDMAAIESGSIKIANEAFDFKAMISALTVLYYSQSESSGIEFDVVLDRLLDEWFIGDQMRVNQILTNLLSNAVKFTPAGGTVKLSIKQAESSEAKSKIIFEVSDTDIGMDPNYLDQIWTPFEQEDSTISRRFGGTGLGLTITKNLVDILGGTIDVKSKKGEGSTFTVALELTRTDQPTNPKVYDFKSINALVVDDDPSTCEYMKLLFSRCGVSCTTVNTGANAIEAVKQAQGSGSAFTLCMVDWRMPELDGIETVRLLRKITGDELPVIVFTAYDFTDIEENARKAGANMFVTKPVFQSTLFDLLTDLSGRTPEPGEQTKQNEKCFSGERVILAEDNEMNMEIAKEILSNLGLTVDSAWNGREVVAMFDSAQEGTYSAILMDVHMPDINGYDAARQIRSLHRSDAAVLPIIAMTADVFAENITKILESGMNDHIPKPIDILQLTAVLKKHIK